MVNLVQIGIPEDPNVGDHGVNIRVQVCALDAVPSGVSEAEVLHHCLIDLAAKCVAQIELK